MKKFHALDITQDLDSQRIYNFIECLVEEYNIWALKVVITKRAQTIESKWVVLDDHALFIGIVHVVHVIEISTIIISFVDQIRFGNMWLMLKRIRTIGVVVCIGSSSGAYGHTAIRVFVAHVLLAHWAATRRGRRRRAPYFGRDRAYGCRTQIVYARVELVRVAFKRVFYAE